MALLADEQFSGGQVRDINGRTVVTTGTLNAALSGGERLSGGRVRDADGRMVVVTETAAATLTAGEQWSDGEVRDSAGRLVVVVDTLNAVLPAGERYSGGQVRDQAGRRVIASDTGAVTLLGGEQVSGGQVRDSQGRMVVRGAGGVVSAYNTAVLADSPVLFQTLSDTSGTVAVDSAAGGLHPGAYTGGFTLNQPGPCSDGQGAVLLDGSTGYVTTPHAAVLMLTQPCSLEFWVKPTDATTINMLVQKSDGVALNGYGSYLNSPTPTLIWMTNGAAGKVTSSAATTAGVWQHVAISDDGTTTLMYVNGVSQAVVNPEPAAVTANTLPVLIGRRPDGYWYKGLIAKVALYSTALVFGQVNAHYAAR